MSRRSQREPDIVETAATVAVGAAAAYGCYKLCESLFGPNQSQPSNVQSSANSIRHDPPPPSLGDTVSKAINGVSFAYNTFKLCETLLDALPQDDRQPTQSTRAPQPIQPALYPDLNRSDRVILPTRNEASSSFSRPSVSGAEVIETMSMLHDGYKLCKSIFGSDSSNSNSNLASCDHHQPITTPTVVETVEKSQEALKKLKEYVFFVFFSSFEIST